MPDLPVESIIREELSKILTDKMSDIDRAIELLLFTMKKQIFIDGNEVNIHSPKDAFDYKIGMIHQHFKLVDVFTAAQNVVLGLKHVKFNMKKIKLPFHYAWVVIVATVSNVLPI